MKKLIFINGKTYDVVFTAPAAFEQVLSDDFSNLLHRQVDVSVITNQYYKKSVIIRIPVHLNGDTTGPDELRDEYVWLIMGSRYSLPTPSFPGFSYTMPIDEFYSLYRDTANDMKASKFESIKVEKQDMWIEIVLTYK